MFKRISFFTMVGAVIFSWALILNVAQSADNATAKQAQKIALETMEESEDYETKAAVPSSNVRNKAPAAAPKKIPAATYLSAE